MKIEDLPEKPFADTAEHPVQFVLMAWVPVAGKVVPLYRYGTVSAESLEAGAEAHSSLNAKLHTARMALMTDWGEMCGEPWRG